LNFWDSSAIVPLLLRHGSTSRAAQWLKEDTTMLVWWGAEIECASALSRIERENEKSLTTISQAFMRLKKLSSSWQEVQPTRTIKEQAIRILRVHNLRATDALQLAAAIIASEHKTFSLPFVCLDARLAEAAQREGFSLLQ
jgi:uncharacterized protein